MFINSPRYPEYLEQRRLLIADFKSQIKHAESKVEAKELKEQMASELSWLEQHYKSW